MAFGDHTIREASEYKEELERLRHIDDPLAQHNAVVELLQCARHDRQLTDLPDYDPVIKSIEQLEVDSGDRLAEMQHEREEEP